MATLRLEFLDDDDASVGSVEVDGDLADLGPLFDEAEKLLLEGTDDADGTEAPGAED